MGEVAAARRAVAAVSRPPGFVALHGGDASVVLVPALGGTIRALTLGGRQWLWENPAPLPAMPDKDAVFADSRDSGGLDECFPTLDACRLPSWVKGAGNALLPDHGELWSRQPEFSISTDELGHSATCTWSGVVFPYRFSRTVTVRTDGSVAFDYTVSNRGEARMPFLWSPHPVFPLTDRTRIVLPEGARTRVWTEHGVELGGPGAEHKWPLLRSRGTRVDLSRPAAVPRDFACKLFVELPRTEVVVSLEEPGARLEMHLHGRQVPNAALWINRRGWPPGQARRSLKSMLRKRAVPRSDVMLAPCLGAPDSLSEALGAWDAAHWLEPGARARWSMWWRGVRVADSVE